MIPRRFLLKLTDFGLTRASVIYQTTDYATSTINIFPFRSSAPEILQSPTDRQLYTEKSDMFSMGVLMWECVSKGAIPWIDIIEAEVKRKVLRGERLKRPDNSLCSDQLWSIILKCMAHQPEDRPTFVQFDRLISNFFPNRAPMQKRYAQYTSLQHQQNNEPNTNNRSTTAATRVDSRQETVTVSQEKFVAIMNSIILGNNDRTAGYQHRRNDRLLMSGSNLYLSGVHRIRLQVALWLEDNVHITFFGIVSDNPKYRNYAGDISEMPCSYGWSEHNIYREGRSFPKSTELPIRCGNIIQLLIDCVNHKISHCIRYKDGTPFVHELVVDTQICPYPWKWYLQLYGKMWCLRLI